ncbi:MAG: fibronectin type III domain-containing protein, partial [Eubacterium sp.]|nr:fibronectin type III domain-containing protein [Eubacterium sp.]
FISNEDGKININFNSLETDTKMHGEYIITLCGPNQEEFAMKTVKVTDTNTAVLPFIGAKAGNYYYMCISPGPNFASGHDYKIRVSFTKGKFYEKEFNDTEEKAGKLILANNYVGTIGSDSLNGDSWGVDDSDFYYIKAPAKGTMTLSFKHKKRDSEYASISGWALDLYKHHNGGNLSLSNGLIPLNDKENVKVYSGQMAKNAELWFSVRSAIYGQGSYLASDIVGEPYTVATTFVLAAKPKITAKSTKNSITLTSKKIADITGYEIQIKEGKKFKKLATTKKKALKYTKKGLKKNKRYTFRVRAYLKADGTKYYGKWVTVSAKTKAK